MIIRPSVLLDDEDVILSLLPELERIFGVTFGQNDFATVDTVGEFVAAAGRRIVATKRVDDTLRCTGQHVFYRLRRALSEVALPGSSAFVPDAALQLLLPLRGRRRQWQRLREVSGLPLPPLRVSGRLFLLLWGLLTVGMTLAVSAWGMAIVIGLVGATVICSWSRLQVVLPCATVGELAAQTVAQQYAVLNGNYVHPMEMRRIVVAGLARCSVEDEPVTAVDLGEATQLKWQSA